MLTSPPDPPAIPTIWATPLEDRAADRRPESRRAWPEVGPEFGTVRAIGGTLYTDYLLAFEIAGVLLLTGIVAAVVMGKQRID